MGCNKRRLEGLGHIPLLTLQPSVMLSGFCYFAYSANLLLGRSGLKRNLSKCNGHTVSPAGVNGGLTVMSRRVLCLALTVKL